MPYPNIDLDINHETPTEQVQAPKEPPEDPITVTVQPPITTDETNIPDQPITGVRISDRLITHTKSCNPRMAVKRYACAAKQMAEH